MTKTLEINGLEEFERAIRDAPDIAWPILKKAMAIGLAMLHDAVAEYPPATAANRPGRINRRSGRPMGYYERGRGWWYPVMKKETLPQRLGKTRGATKAPRRSRVAGYKLAGGGKSELLGRKWTTDINQSDDALTGVLGNTASYARYVQGDQQNRIHARRNWKTLSGVLDDLEEDIVKIFDEALVDLLRKLEE